MNSRYLGVKYSDAHISIGTSVKLAVYMYICIFIHLSIYWKSGTSNLMVLMLFVLQCTDYKSFFLTLTLTSLDLVDSGIMSGPIIWWGMKGYHDEWRNFIMLLIGRPISPPALHLQWCYLLKVATAFLTNWFCGLCNCRLMKVITAKTA